MVEKRISVYLIYQALLGLQLDLQGLQGPLQVVDLSAGGLEGLCAGCNLLVEFVKLENKKLDINV